MLRTLILLGLLAGLVAVAPVEGTHGPRTEVERYVAGAGDSVCIVKNLGCVQFEVQGGERQVAITVRDDIHNPVAANICSPTCAHNSAGCGTATLDGLVPGDPVNVFIAELAGLPVCGPGLGAGFKGTVTAVFT